MKKTLISSLMLVAFSAMAATPLPQGCYMQASTVGEAAGTISEVADTKNWVTPAVNNQKKCIVTFRGKANNKWYSGTGEYVFTTAIADDTGCDVALENGKKSLAEQVYGKKIVKAEQMVCSDFPTVEDKPSVKVGEVVAISQLKPHPTKTKPFGYKGAECRYFTETAIEENFYVYQGVACSVGNGKWRVVDKW